MASALPRCAIPAKSHLQCDGAFRPVGWWELEADGAAVLAGIGAAPVRAGGGIDHDALPTAEAAARQGRRLILDDVTETSELRADSLRQTVLERDAIRIEIVEARVVDRFLDVRSGVEELGDELDMPLRLHVTAHDAERDQR